MDVVMCICSAQRRDMLRSCIASFKQLVVPETCTLRLVVVDNNQVAECADALADIVPDLPFSTQVVHEPVAGIPQARNRAIETALQHDPDFIGFIDDDETVSAGWLEAMARAHATYRADVYNGPVHPAIEDGCSVWLQHQRSRRQKRTTGTRRPVAATGNVLFSAGLVSGRRMNLRFDERLRYCGGEDTDFFARANAQGAVIVWVAEALILEHVPGYRQTFVYMARRSFREGCNKAECLPTGNGRFSTTTFLMLKGIYDVTKGTIYLGLIPYYAVFRASQAPGKLLRAAKRVMRGVGYIAGLLGFTVQPYRDPARS